MPVNYNNLHPKTHLHIMTHPEQVTCKLPLTQTHHCNNLQKKTTTKAQRLRPDSSSWHRDRTSLKTTRTSVNACTPRTPAAVVRCNLQADGRRRGGEGGWAGRNHSIEVVGCWCVQASVTPARTKTRHITTTHFTPRRSPPPRYSSFNASIVLPVSDPA